MAELCYHKSHYAATEIGRLPGVTVNPHAPDKPFFKEFVVAFSKPVEAVNTALMDESNIVGGYDLGTYHPSIERHMLIAVTEENARSDIDRLVEALRKITA